MPKAKPPREDRIRRKPRDPAAEREKSWRPADVDEDFDDSDGSVQLELDELDTDRYEVPSRKR